MWRRVKYIRMEVEDHQHYNHDEVKGNGVREYRPNYVDEEENM